MKIQLNEFPNYTIDNLGNVYNKFKNILSPQKDKHTGYYFVNLYNENGMSRKSIHRLVLTTFTSLIDMKFPVVNHKDGNKSNNSLDNLEWCSYSENTRHAYENGLITSYKGENSHRATLSNNQCIELITELLQGKDNQELGDKYNLHPNYISLIRTKKRWASIWETHFPDMVASKSKKCPNRENILYKTKLNLDTQLNIIKRIHAGEILRKLAMEYSLDPSMLSRVKSRKTWKRAYKEYDKLMSNDHRTPSLEELVE